MELSEHVNKGYRQASFATWMTISANGLLGAAKVRFLDRRQGQPRQVRDIFHINFSGCHGA